MIADLAVTGYVGICAGMNSKWTAETAENVLASVSADCIIYSLSNEEKISEIRHCYNALYICIERDFPSLIAEGQELLSSMDDIFRFPERDADEVCKIAFSSGTTAVPKAACLTQRNMLCGWDNLYRRAPMNETDRCYLFLPLNHTYAGICVFIFSLISGMKLYLCSDTEKIPEELLLVKPTVFCGVPLIYERISTLAAAKNIPLADAFGGKIRYMFCGGAYFDSSLRKLYKDSGLNMLEAYALTETSSICSIEYSGNASITSVGTVFENIEVSIASPDENGRGEILIKGDNVFKGYYNDPEATQAAFDENGFFKTGDIGWIDSDNQLYITGRKKRLLLTSNGENADPQRIEKKLEACEFISRAVVYDDGHVIKAKLFVTDTDADVGSVVDSVNCSLSGSERIAEYTVIADSIDVRYK